MNRHYTTAEYAAGCEILRKHFHNPAITTDVIVGFAGETEEEFAQTEAFLEQIHFYEMHVFKYSRRAGTRADRMPNQIPEPVKTERSDVLLKLEQKMSEEYRRSFLNQNLEVLLEEKVTIDGIDYMLGHTKEYVKVAVPYHPDMKNVFVTGTAEKMLNDETLFVNL
jgi:threonylcarbamoyladenosine tRNA methylthiotransferase MtaB